MLRLRLVVPMLVLVVVIAGCGGGGNGTPQPTEPTIDPNVVGNWEGADGIGVLVIRANGTFRVNTVFPNSWFEGTASFLNGAFEMCPTSFAPAQAGSWEVTRGTYTVVGNELRLTYVDDGESSTDILIRTQRQTPLPIDGVDEDVVGTWIGIEAWVARQSVRKSSQYSFEIRAEGTYRYQVGDFYWEEGDILISGGRYALRATDGSFDLPVDWWLYGGTYDLDNGILTLYEGEDTVFVGERAGPGPDPIEPLADPDAVGTWRQHDEELGITDTIIIRADGTMRWITEQEGYEPDWEEHTIHMSDGNFESVITDTSSGYYIGYWITGTYEVDGDTLRMVFDGVAGLTLTRV